MKFNLPHNSSAFSKMQIALNQVDLYAEVTTVKNNSLIKYINQRVKYTLYLNN
jgi:hypothetical protein